MSAAVSVKAVNGAAIDRAHLDRMTLGDNALAREVLTLFERQASGLNPNMRLADNGQVIAFAHALKGAARGIGAFAVADAAESLERDARDPFERQFAVDRLADAVAAARMEISAIVEAA